MIAKLIKFAILSAPTCSIITPEGKRLRSQLNLLIISPYGSGKTTLSRKIEEEKLGVRVMRYTEPAILGSISRKGELILPDVVRGAGKLVMIDEFQEIPPKLRRPLLSLMEEQLAERSLAFRVSPTAVEGDYYSIYAYGGSFQIRVRASYLISTMEFRSSSYMDRALISRCFPLALGFGYEDAQELVYGKREISGLDKVKNALDDFRNAEVRLKKTARDEVWKHIRERLEEIGLEAGHAVRAFGDIARISAVLSILDNSEYIEWYDELIPYIDVYTLSLRGAELSARDYTVLEYINENSPISVNSIVNHFLDSGYSRGAIAWSLDKLLNSKLIRMKRGIIEVIR